MNQEPLVNLMYSPRGSAILGGMRRKSHKRSRKAHSRRMSRGSAILGGYALGGYALGGAVHRRKSLKKHSRKSLKHRSMKHSRKSLKHRSMKHSRKSLKHRSMKHSRMSVGGYALGGAVHRRKSLKKHSMRRLSLRPERRVQLRKHHASVRRVAGGAMKAPTVYELKEMCRECGVKMSKNGIPLTKRQLMSALKKCGL